MNTGPHAWPEASQATLALLDKACRDGQPAQARYHTAQLILDGTPLLALRWMVYFQLRAIGPAHLGMWELLREAYHALHSTDNPHSKQVRTVLFRSASALANAPKCSIVGDLADMLYDQFQAYGPVEANATLATLPGLSNLLRLMQRDDLDLEWKLCQRLHLSCRATHLQGAHLSTLQLCEMFLAEFRKHRMPTAPLQETADDLAYLMLQLPDEGHLWLLQWALMACRPLDHLVVDERVCDEAEHCQDALDLELPARVRPTHNNKTRVINDYHRRWVQLELSPAQLQALQECGDRSIRLRKRPHAPNKTRMDLYLTEAQQRALLS